MATSGVEAAVEVEVDSAVKDGLVVLHIMKIWGTVDLLHRGSRLTGGMTWEPEDVLSVGIPVDEKILNTEQLAGLFSDLVGSLLPSIKVLVTHVEEKSDDF